MNRIIVLKIHRFEHLRKYQGTMLFENFTLKKTNYLFWNLKTIIIIPSVNSSLMCVALILDNQIQSRLKINNENQDKIHV